MSAQLSVADVLERAADLIEPEGAWTTEVEARDAFGEETDVKNEGAVCFCAAGAIWASAPYPLNAQVCRALELLVGGDIPEWNDADGRTQAEVVAKLREAAVLARSTPNDADNQWEEGR